MNTDDIKQMQAKVGVAADGVWGPLTRKAVFGALGIADAPSEAPAGVLTPSRAAFENIKAFESCELDAYPDPGSGGDPWTIGWGATGLGIRKGVRWTQQQADDRLKEDVERFSAGVSKLIGSAATTQGEFDALVSFAYNVGLGALEKSTLLRKHKSGDKAGAAIEFAKWVNAAGKPMKGLIRRRAAERALYEGRA